MIIGQLASKRADGEGDVAYDYGVEGRLLAVRQGGRALMAAAYDGDGRRVMQASPYHEQVEGTDGAGMGDAAACEGDEGQEGLSLWSLGLFWYGFAAGGAAALSAPNPAVMAHAVEGACALVEASWPDGAFDPDAADYALAHLGLPAFDLAAMTGGYGISDGEPAITSELLDVVTYTNSSVIANVAQVAFSHSTRSGDSAEAYGLDRLSKSEGGATASYICDGRGSVAQALTGAGSVSSWHMWGTFGEQEAGSSLGELPSYGYNAEEVHPQTGLQYLRARYYDASTGRFGVQDDFLGSIFSPLTLNRYLYCLSDALNWVDPSGHKSDWQTMLDALKSPAQRLDEKLAAAGDRQARSRIAARKKNALSKIGLAASAYRISKSGLGTLFRATDSRLRTAEHYKLQYWRVYCSNAAYAGKYIMSSEDMSPLKYDVANEELAEQTLQVTKVASIIGVAAWPVGTATSAIDAAIHLSRGETKEFAWDVMGAIPWGKIIKQIKPSVAE